MKKNRKKPCNLVLCRFTSKKVVQRALLFGRIETKEEQNEIIGRRLQDVRESAHMDFYDMAKLLRVSVGHYRKIERGVYGLDVEKLVILYEKLDVDPLYLLAGRQKARRESVDSHLAIRNRRVCELLEYCKQQLSDEGEEYR